MDEPELHPFTAADADWLIERHRALYARDEGFDESFGALVAEIVAGFLAGHDPVQEAGWIAWHDDTRLGSIFVVALDDTAAKLRLFLVEPQARGTGLAQRMLETAMDFARSAGFRRMTLGTHESHRAAGRLYARNGFVLEGETRVKSFGRENVEQVWTRAL